MARGEHLAEMNRQRADDRRAMLESALTAPEPATSAQPATAVLDQPEPAQPEITPQPLSDPPKIVTTEDEIREQAEMDLLRAQNTALLEELKQARDALKSSVTELGLPLPTSKARVSKDLPPNYVVWLGTEPLGDTELRMVAKGRVGQLTHNDVIMKTPQRGKREPFPVSRTTHGGLTGEFINQGYTKIRFDSRCPANHRYAGKLWARIDCPEHAAWLFITAPNGRGGDIDQHPLYAFRFTLESYKNRYELLKRTHLQRRQAELLDQEDVMSDAVDMPEDVTQGWQ
jgi:hypothetical protein